MLRKTAATVLGLVLLIPGPAPGAADEGMYPVSDIRKLDLRSKGLAIDPAEIYSTDKSLIFAIVSVGATGSFISPEGLFITNHHVAFGAVQAASTTEKDYLRHGFLAPSKADEIPARGMTARITESFKDVSAEVLSAVAPGQDYAARTAAIEKRTKEIVARAEKESPGKRAEVAEMFIGRSYVLFIYTYLKDIRLVYVPPRAIGEFGGEDDNWMWPRHTGDFSFLRAYVAPDGSPADYSPWNVPFTPQRFLEIEPRGVGEGDFVLLLGYPGRTYRHHPSSYLAYDEEVRMPYVADWYAWQIDLLEKMGAADRGVGLRHASRIKGLANTMKNYRGKLKGMKRLGLVARRRGQEAGLRNFIDAEAARRARYGDVLPDIGKIYDEMRAMFEYVMLLDYLRGSVNLLNYASTVYEASLERRKPDLERESRFMERNFPQTKQRLLLSLRNYYEPTDKAILKELLLRASKLEGPNRIAALDQVFKGDFREPAVDAFIQKSYAASTMSEAGFVESLLAMSPERLAAVSDPFLDLARALQPAVEANREKQKARRGELDPLFARLSEVEEVYQGKDFIPDANGTLRLTYGRVKGYQPADAVSYKPFTALSGILEKTTGREPYDTPAALIDLARARDFGAFEHPALRDVPVCLLYDADTTGGNSGSPVLNARGRLVGVNFDRTYEATVNDYVWSEDYSRSIGVDIRYVLWVAQKFGKAGSLLKEIGVE